MTDPAPAPARPPIETILLRRGTRGMDRIAPHLPPDFCASAARALWAARARTLITTGFYVAGFPETDGPPGAFFLARGLALCGGWAGFVAEEETLGLLRALTGAMWPVAALAPEFLPFPIADTAASRAFAADLAARWRPGAVVAVERCGRTAAGTYLNMRREDISPYTAQVDDLLRAPGAVSVGVGDGGNEVGMGCVVDALRDALGLEAPCVTLADHLVIATVSNWGAYGLLAYLSRYAGRDLLPSDAESADALRRLAALGAINGMSRRAEALVDGFPPEVEAAVLAELREAVRLP